MASEDNFLRLDEEFALSEIKKRVADGDFSHSDIELFFQQNLISIDEYEYCVEILERRENV